MNKLELFCLAIRSFEGYSKETRSYRNNNPGNLRYSKYTSDLGAYAKDTAGFCIFRSYNDGWNALRQLVTDAANGALKWTHGGVTVLQFFQGITQSDGSYLGGYAPSSDNNNPLHYARFVAGKAGLQVDDPLSKVLS